MVLQVKASLMIKVYTLQKKLSEGPLSCNTWHSGFKSTTGSAVCPWTQHCITQKPLLTQLDVLVQYCSFALGRVFNIT
jgi:hypothetical protein